MAKHWWIVAAIVVLVVVICLLGMIARTIARSQSGLDKKEMAVARRAAGPSPFVGDGGGELVGLDLVTLNLLVALWWFACYKHRAAVKKVVGFDPSEQNRAEGVIFWFYELRITRTELIKGYEENARRIPLRGLTATVTTAQTVYITIEGPDTKFVYRKGFDTEIDLRRARQFAALLNYEASRPPTPAPAQHQEGCMCGRCCQQRVAARRPAREDFESEM